MHKKLGGLLVAVAVAMMTCGPAQASHIRFEDPQANGVFLNPGVPNIITSDPSGNVNFVTGAYRTATAGPESNNTADQLILTFTQISGTSTLGNRSFGSSQEVLLSTDFSPTTFFTNLVNFNGTYVGTLNVNFQLSSPDYDAVRGAGQSPALTETQTYQINVQTAAVPEPGTMTLMGLGLAGLIGAGRRKKKRAQAA